MERGRYSDAIRLITKHGNREEGVQMHIQPITKRGNNPESLRLGSDLATASERVRQFDDANLTDPDYLYCVGLSNQQSPWHSMLYHAIKGPEFSTDTLGTLLSKLEDLYREEQYLLMPKIREEWQRILAFDQQRRDNDQTGIKNLGKFHMPPRMPTCVGRALWSPRPRNPEAVWFFTHACYQYVSDEAKLMFTTIWRGRECRWLVWSDPNAEVFADQALVDVLAEHALRRIQWLAEDDNTRIVRYEHDHNRAAPPGLEHVVAYRRRPLDPDLVEMGLDNVGRMMIGRKDAAGAGKLVELLGRYLNGE